MFRAFSDSTRLRILNLLRHGELCVGDLVAALAESQPKVSRHLGYLKRAGLVETRRSGKWMYYSMACSETPFHKNLLACLSSCFADVPQIRADLRRAGIVRDSGGCCPDGPPDCLPVPVLNQEKRINPSGLLRRQGRK